MRKFILVANAFLLVLWLISTLVSYFPAHHFDPTGFYGTIVFFVLPAVAIGVWGRWLPFGIGLTGISLIMTFVLFAASQIAS
jgi:hypothetical protein